MAHVNLFGAVLDRFMITIVLTPVQTPLPLCKHLVSNTYHWCANTHPYPNISVQTLERTPCLTLTLTLTLNPKL